MFVYRTCPKLELFDNRTTMKTSEIQTFWFRTFTVIHLAKNNLVAGRVGWLPLLTASLEVGGLNLGAEIKIVLFLSFISFYLIAFIYRNPIISWMPRMDTTRAIQYVKLRQFAISNWIIVVNSNLDNNFDTNPIPSQRSSQQSRFRSNFDLFSIKVNHFWSLFLSSIRINHISI